MTSRDMFPHITLITLASPRPIITPSYIVHPNEKIKYNKDIPQLIHTPNPPLPGCLTTPKVITSLD